MKRSLPWKNYKTMTRFGQKSKIIWKRNFFVVAFQLKDIRLNEKQIIATQENHARILNNAISVIESNSRSWMACSQYFYARDQKLKLQIKLASSLLALNNEIKSYRIANYAYRLTVLNAVKTMVEKLIPMTLLSKNDWTKSLANKLNQLIDSLLQSRQLKF